MYFATSSEPEKIHESRASPESHIMMCIYRGTKLAPACRGTGLAHAASATWSISNGKTRQRPFWGLRHGLRQNASHGRRARARAPVSAAHPQKLSCSGVPRSHIPGACASAEGLGSPHPHLRRDWAHPCHICTGTGLAPAHLQRDWARPCRSCDLVTLRIDRSRCAQSRLGACHARVSVLFATFLVCQFGDQLVALGLEACVLLEPLRAIM
jgi:hypothetical protein